MGQGSRRLLVGRSEGVDNTGVQRDPGNGGEAQARRCCPASAMRGIGVCVWGEGMPPAKTWNGGVDVLCPHTSSPVLCRQPDKNGRVQSFAASLIGLAEGVRVGGNAVEGRLPAEPSHLPCRALPPAPSKRPRACVGAHAASMRLSSQPISGLGLAFRVWGRSHQAPSTCPSLLCGSRCKGTLVHPWHASLHLDAGERWRSPALTH